MAEELQVSASPQPSQANRTTGKLILSLVVFLFFLRGFVTVLLYSLVPKLRSLFALSYAEVMLTQLCFFLGYFVFSLPAAYAVKRLGYLRAIILGLAIMILGCLILSPSMMLGQYRGFLAALFVIAAGITLSQVADNPLIAVLGTARGSCSRLTLAQAFNSLGTTVAPLAVAWLIFTPGQRPLQSLAGIRALDLQAIQSPFFLVAGVLAVVGSIFWFNRNYPMPRTSAIQRKTSYRSALFANRRFLFGAIAIFLYVGAEVSIGSIMTSYLMQPAMLSVSAYRASQLLTLYWGGAMCGRFVGSALLRIVPAGLALSVCGAFGAFLAILSSSLTGPAAAAAIIAIGLFNSIMFPTIFALALEGLGDATPEGSGILCTAIVGGAVVPEITGITADMRGLSIALLVPAACYFWITAYGAYVERHGVLRKVQRSGAQ